MSGILQDNFDLDETRRLRRKPNAAAAALLDKIERGEAEMAGPFKTFEEYKAWLSEADDDEANTAIATAIYRPIGF